MKIGLIDVDGHNFPNLALMKLSAWHKAQGDAVEWWWGWDQYDRVYMSKIFDDTYTPDVPEPLNAKEIIKGGTGYGLNNKLLPEVEHSYPDYSLYPELTKDTAFGFLTRGCPRACDFCIVSRKEGRRAEKVADLSEFWDGQKHIKLLDPNLLACKDHIGLLRQLSDSKAWIDYTQGLDARLLTEDNIAAINQTKTKALHFAWDYMEQSEAVIRGLDLYGRLGAVKDRRRRTVYILVNHGTSMEENLRRIYTVRDRQYTPFVMVYDKPNADKKIRRLQRWVNNNRIFRTCERFEDYK